MEINSEMVVLARESRGLTQKELIERIRTAKGVKVSQGTLSKIENDVPVDISPDFLSGLSETLRYPVTFFYNQGERISTGLCFHRKRKRLGKRSLDKIEASATLRSQELKKLLSKLEIESNVRRFPLDNYTGGPEDVARALRYYWKVPKGPIKNMTSILEDNGIVIVECNFGTSLLDGFFLDIMPPIIFTNTKIPGDRLRFTLAHELGHLVMHTVPHNEMDIQADRFASEFLMPEEEIRPYLRGRMSLQKLADLKPIWKVSMAALLKRAGDLDVIPEHSKRYLWMQMGKAGYRTREPLSLDVPKEHPTLLQEIIDSYFHRLKMTVQDISEMLNLLEAEFRSIYLKESPPNLRIVT